MQGRLGTLVFAGPTLEGEVAANWALRPRQPLATHCYAAQHLFVRVGEKTELSVYQACFPSPAFRLTLIKSLMIMQ